MIPSSRFHYICFLPPPFFLLSFHWQLFSLSLLSFLLYLLSFSLWCGVFFLSTFFPHNQNRTVHHLRINFYLLRTFPPHLGSFCVVYSFTTFRPNFTSGLLQVILPRPRIGKMWCDRQQLWKAVITGDTVTRLSIPIRGRGKITWRTPEVKFGRNVVKE